MKKACDSRWNTAASREPTARAAIMSPPEPLEGTPELPLSEFPRGTKAGSFFHDILEHYDFVSARPGPLEKLVARARRAREEADLVDHRRQIERTQPLVGERQADEPASLLRHEVDEGRVVGDVALEDRQRDHAQLVVADGGADVPDGPPVQQDRGALRRWLVGGDPVQVQQHQAARRPARSRRAPSASFRSTASSASGYSLLERRHTSWPRRRSVFSSARCTTATSNCRSVMSVRAVESDRGNDCTPKDPRLIPRSVTRALDASAAARTVRSRTRTSWLLVIACSIGAAYCRAVRLSPRRRSS